MGNKIRFGFDVDDGGAVRKIKGVSREFDKLGGKGSGASLFGNVGAKAIAKGFDLIADAASGAIGFAMDSIDAFSELQQASGAVEAIFEDQAKVIDEWADTSATAWGISERAAKESAAIIGAKLKGLGVPFDEIAGKTIELEERAADMAATFGGTSVDAIHAISSALTGERDPIEKYGVSIKEADVKAKILALGLDTSTTAAEKNAVAVATMALIMDGTSATRGKFAEETNTIAGKQAIANAKMEEAQAALGEKLAPLMLTFTDFMINTGIPMIEKIAEAWGAVASAIEKSFGWYLDFLGLSEKQSSQHGASFKDALAGANAADFGGGKATGGWVGMDGEEIIRVGENGPEYITPTHQAVSGSGGGITIEGVSAKDLARIIDEQLYVKLRRAAPTAGRI